MKISYDAETQTLHIDLAPSESITRFDEIAKNVVLGYSGEHLHRIDIHHVEPDALRDIDIDVPQPVG